MSRRRRRAPSLQGILGLLVVGGAIAAFSSLSQLLSSNAAPTIAGMVLSIVGAVAVMVWRGGRQRLRAKTLVELLALTPTGFEQATADLLHDLGYTDVKRMGGAGDLNVDIWCRDQDGKRVAVQCKRYGPANRVGSPEVQTFIGMIFQHHGADQGMFVTTSSFTGHALRLASEHRITPIDGDALAAMIVDAQARARAKSNARPRFLRAPVLAVALPLGLVLLGCAAVSELPSSTPVSDGAVAVTSVSNVAVAVTPALQVGSPTQVPGRSGNPAATPTPATMLIVGNTEGQGVFLRRTPVLSDRVKAYEDGIQLQVIGPDVDAGGVHWRHVAAPDGALGYVPSEFVIADE